MGKKEKTNKVLEDRVKVLSEKIRNILETVAPMKKKKLEHREKNKTAIRRVGRKNEGKSKIKNES